MAIHYFEAGFTVHYWNLRSSKALLISIMYGDPSSVLFMRCKSKRKKNKKPLN